MATLENSLVVPQKIGNSLLEDPAIPFMSIYPKDAPTYDKYACSIMFIGDLFIIDRSWKQPRCPLTRELIQIMWYIYRKIKKSPDDSLQTKKTIQDRKRANGKQHDLPLRPADRDIHPEGYIFLI